jgi:hypothetical protein
MRPTASFEMGMSNGPTSRPWNITATRSARARTSSSSEDTSTTAVPSSRLTTICLWMYSIDPTSTPRVGWEATSTSIGRSNSRATTTFCWLPPDREPAGVVTDGVRMS